MPVTDPSSYGSEKDSRNATSMQDEKKADEKFALGRKGALVFFTLSVLTLMAALDGTSISVALPVRTSLAKSED
jgi:hypothetical protein